MKNNIVNANFAQQLAEHVPSLDRESLDKVLSSIRIPPQLATMVSLQKELTNEYPNNKVISDIICQDMAVAADVIKTINSPFFGLKNKVDNIQGAATLLGMSNVVNIVNTFSLKDAMKGGDYPEIDGYFDSANEVALVAAGLAKELGVMASDVAYTIGLFHDVGIPMLQQKFSNYAEILQYAYVSEGLAITDIEDHNLNTNHAIVGYYVCKTWNMPKYISATILNHHNVEEILSSGSQSDVSELKVPVAIITMAEYIAYAYHGKAKRTNWEEESPLVMDCLGITDQEFDVIKAAMFDKLGE